jgi:hypothetical protein
MTTLYKKDISHNVLFWNIDSDDIYIVITTGRLNEKSIHYVYEPKGSIAREMEAKIRDKRIKGWLSISDLKLISEDLDSLKRLLPYDQTDLNNRKKPQKAVLFKTNTFKYPAYIQPKINGVRCTISWEIVTEGDGLFKTTTEKVVISSKEGHTYVLPHIESKFTKDMFMYFHNSEYIDIVYDGELYKHGLKLNEIRKCIPMTNSKGTISKPSGNPNNINFICFDLAIPDIPQHDRFKIITDLLYGSKEPIVVLDSYVVNSDSEATSKANQFINAGYEGGILRDSDATYGFGKRATHMMKLKKWFTTKCTILDIIQKNEVVVNNKTRTYIAFVLKNDLNDETFECTPMGDEDYRIELLEQVNNHIGKQALIKFRERSGTKNVPFQAVLTSILE